MRAVSGETNRTFDLESYQPLPVSYQLRHTLLQKLKQGEDPFPDIQGREEAKQDVIRALLSGSHLYLVSEEGMGKTRLARSLAKLLPPIPGIKGCPYHDDPKWPREWLCPRCRQSADPVKEWGFELFGAEARFSRVQGNEYTNEAKLLGFKDIRAIAEGRSPADPSVFTGTGVFRANRGILFLDELPAVPTKVQVLLHPVLEEKKVILEEYGWEHPVDLMVVATGNPQGFSHVNEVPRPLLDRLELVCLGPPKEEIEREIALRERFLVSAPFAFPAIESTDSYPHRLAELERQAALPWWTLDLLNRAVRQSRVCPWLDRAASIRGTTRALDHTLSSAELAGHKVATLKDACQGLKLALRGRLGLRADLVDYDKPAETYARTDEVVEDLLWNALEDFTSSAPSFDGAELARDLTMALAKGAKEAASSSVDSGELGRALAWIRTAGKERRETPFLTKREKELNDGSPGVSPEMVKEYLASALEVLVNSAVHRGLVDESVREHFFVPRKASWGGRGGEPWRLR